jgi:hypothetical protein
MLLNRLVRTLVADTDTTSAIGTAAATASAGAYNVGGKHNCWSASTTTRHRLFAMICTLDATGTN